MPRKGLDGAGKQLSARVGEQVAAQAGVRIAIALAAGLAAIVLIWGSGLAEIIGNVQYDREMRSLVRAEARMGSEAQNGIGRNGTLQDGTPIEGQAGSGTRVPEIVLVLIDQSSLSWVQDNLGLGWPWPRELYGVMAEYLKEAEVQAWDILCTEVSQYGAEDDARCSEMMQKAGNVVLARLSGRMPVIDLPVEQLGTVNALLDRDGVVRRYPLWSGQGSERIPSLGLRSVTKLAYGSDPSRSAEAPGGLFAGLSKTGKGDVLLRFRPSARFSRYSAAQILASALAADARPQGLPPPERFRKSIVLVGISAPGIPDRQAVPVDPAMAGVEIHATFVDNALRGAFMKAVPPVVPLAAALLMSGTAAVLPLFGRKAGRRWFAPILLAVWAGIPLFSHIMFRYGIWISTLAGLVPASVSLMTALALAYHAEGRQRAYLKKAFAHYLAPEVIAQLVEHPSRLNLGGEERRITVLFSDMEGFTGISERLGPEKLAAFMNRYLGMLSEEILAAGGTLDKYIGDAVVAFWNAPLEIGCHAEKAILAAVRIQKRLAEEGEDLLREYGCVPHTRIGIATGQAVVGNLGSSVRFAYTAVGDAVNVASRLEGICKVLNTRILLTRATVEQYWAERQGSVSGSPAQTAIPLGDRDEVNLEASASETHLLMRLGMGLVEGKTIPVELWTVWPVPGASGDLPARWDGVRTLWK